MKSLLFSGFVFGLSVLPMAGQELFPNTESASTVPKGVLGVRVFDETYREVDLLRNLFVLRLMYGVLPKLTVMANASMSNHHGIEFPPNLASHTHPKKGASVYSTGTIARGIPYPYLFNGECLYAKYRFFSSDGQGKHLRMSVYGEWSNINVAHDEAEPDLLDDTKGYGGGLIVTYLINHLAVSITSGVIIPLSYNGYAPDPLGGGLVPTQLFYGRAVQYDLSLGYLLFPRTYKSYDESNINVYVEFMGKSYGEAKIIQYGVKDVPISTPLLEAGNYVDITPGVQEIIRSNLRIDLSAEFPLINRSYAHFYPVFMLGIQRYFFPDKKPGKHLSD